MHIYSVIYVFTVHTGDKKNIILKNTSKRNLISSLPSVISRVLKGKRKILSITKFIIILQQNLLIRYYSISGIFFC